MKSRIAKDLIQGDLKNLLSFSQDMNFNDTINRLPTFLNNIICRIHEFYCLR